MSRLLFSTGTARGGTGLLTQVLGVHPEISVVLEAYLALFKSFRAAVIRHQAGEAVRAAFDPNAPLQDYYFTEVRLETMDLIQRASMELPFEPAERPAVLEALRQRTPLESADLVPLLDRLEGRTYRALFTSALELAAEARGKPRCAWAGMHENWAVEFFAPLARTFPEAKFIIFLRDPRAVVASHRLVKDPQLIAQTLSYARHLRKYAAFALHYQADPLFAGRLAVVRYEDLVRAPEATTRQLCDFLNVPFDPAMLDPERHTDRATGQVWDGLSSYEPSARGFGPHRIDRWRASLPEPVVKTVEFLCSPEMSLFGYTPTLPAAAAWPDGEVLDVLLKDQVGEKNWRTDFGVPEQDIGCELFRKLLLRAAREELEPRLIRRAFLFEVAYYRARQLQGRSARAGVDGAPLMPAEIR